MAANQASDLSEKNISISEANKVVEYALKGIFEKEFYMHLYPTTGGVKQVDFPMDSFFGGDSITILDASDEVHKKAKYKILASTNPEAEDLVTFPVASPTTIDWGDIVKLDASSINKITTSADVTNPHVIKLILSSEPKDTSGKYKKKIEVELAVSAPNYTFDSGIVKKLKKVKENEILEHAIIAEGTVTLNNSTIDGNVYAYGMDGTGPKMDYEYSQSRSAYGTITADGDNTINGNLECKGVIRVPQNGKLTVSDSLYSTALYVAEDSSTEVNGNMYLYSDLFVEGNGAEVIVGNSSSNGYIWALHSGSGIDEYTRTGSIIFSKNATKYKSDEDPMITANGLYLSGVVRYDVQNADTSSYRTGESMTTYNNTEYYQTLGSNNIYQTGVIAKLDEYTNASNTYKLIKFFGYSNLDQVDYRKNHYYTMGYYAQEDLSNTFKKISDVDKNLIEIRSLDPTTFDKVHANGIIPVNGKVYRYDRTGLRGFGNDSAYETADRNINWLGYYSGNPITKEQLFDDWFNTTSSAENPKELNVSPSSAVSSAGGVITISDNSKGLIYTANKVVIQDGVTFEGVIFVKSDKDVILGEGAQVNKGMIITKGNVILGENARVSYDKNSVYVNFYSFLYKEASLLGNDPVYDIGYINPDITNDAGRKMTINSNSGKPVDFKIEVGNNGNKIPITVFEGAESEYIGILKSNTVKLVEWREVNNP